jgi:hypothetical protein
MNRVRRMVILTAAADTGIVAAAPEPEKAIVGSMWVLPESYKSVTRVLHECYKSVRRA